MKFPLLVITCLAGALYLAVRHLFCADLLESLGVPAALALLALGGAGGVLGCQLVNARRALHGKASWSLLTGFLVFVAFMSLMLVFAMLGFLACVSSAGER